MYLQLFKALHIVGFVAWFAGLFYLVRMFVYHVEAFDKPQPARDILAQQFSLMERRVFRFICVPAINITWLCGVTMLFFHGLDWLKENWWMHLKLALLVGLTAYHEYCGTIIKKLERGERPFTSAQFRLLNEVPTLFLVLIPVLAVFRNNFNIWYTLAGMAGFGLLLFAGAKMYGK